MKKKNQIKITSLIITALFAVIAPYAAYATQAEVPPAMPLEQQEKLQLLYNAVDKLQDLGASIERASMKSKGQCMKAIGNEQFCKCIVDNSSIIINFVDYVALVSTTKEDLGYDRLSESDKKTVDSARLARDKCVKWYGKPN